MSSQSSVASEDLSSMGDSLSAMLETLKQLRKTEPTPTKATHPCDLEAEKYDCTTVSCLQKHSADLSDKCAAYLLEALAPSPEPVVVVPVIELVAASPSPS